MVVDKWRRTYMEYMSVFSSRNVRRLVIVKSILDSLTNSLAAVMRLLGFPTFRDGFGEPVCSLSSHQMIDGA